jgi:translation elongation factor EF-1alpha
MDTVQYKEARFEEIKESILGHLTKLGVNKEVCPVVPASAWVGENLVKPSGI